jgi:hypothetical protein
MTEYPKRLNRFPKELINQLKPQELQELRLLLALPDSIHQLQTSLTESERSQEKAFYQERIDENLQLLDDLTDKWNIGSIDLTPYATQLVEEPLTESIDS